MVRILVLYHSRHGSVAALAAEAARGINSVGGAEAVLRTVPSVSPDTVASQPEIPDTGPPFASYDELAACDGLLLGSPVRFGNMAAPLKYFLDGTSSLWLSGALRGKPAGVFTSASSMHGGHESTLLTMAIPLLHHGMVLVGVPYAEAALSTTRGGGTPYGASHLAPDSGNTRPDADEARIARHQGQRLAEAALRLKGWSR